MGLDTRDQILNLTSLHVAAAPTPETAGHMPRWLWTAARPVDAMQPAAAAHGGQADANPPEDHGFIYSRGLAEPDGHMWATIWMNPQKSGA